MAAEKCPNCGQFKFEPSWGDNNPGCITMIIGFVLGGVIQIMGGGIIGFIIFAVIFIIGVIIIFKSKKKKTKTYQCENCKFKEDYKIE